MPNKKKRTNPHHKPVSKAQIKPEVLIKEERVDALPHAWLLVLSAFLESGRFVVREIVEIWGFANQFVMHPMISENDLQAMKKHIEILTGLKLSYCHIELDHIRNEGDLGTVKRKIQKNAIYAALILICFGLEKTGQFTADELKNLFLSADISLMEIERGRRSYTQIIKELNSSGIKALISNDDSLILSF